MHLSEAGAAPREISSGDASYISGGIGSDEAAEMKTMASRYPLEIVSIVNAGPKEQYNADFRVVIKDRNGNTVIDAQSEGPFFFANLPAGNYLVETMQDGIQKMQKVALKKGVHQRLVFAWPS